MTNQSWSEKARSFAKQRHKDQTFGPHATPFVDHLALVVALIQMEGGGEQAETIGWLHDVLEDTPTTAEELGQHFPRFVVDTVRSLTDDPSLSRQDQVVAQFNTIRIKHPVAKLIKICDQAANILHNFHMWREDHLVWSPQQVQTNALKCILLIRHISPGVAPTVAQLAESAYAHIAREMDFYPEDPWEVIRGSP